VELSSPDYACLIESALAAAPPILDFSAETPATIQVERGLILPLALTRAAPDTIHPCVDPILQSSNFNQRTVIDQSGHRRHVYRGLLLYTTLLGLTLADHDRPNWPRILRPILDSLEMRLAQMDWSTNAGGALPASGGAAATEAAWNALALHVASALYNQPFWRATARQTFHRFAAAQQPAGPFLRATASDNPETHWYHELVLLHAVATFAAHTNDTHLAGAAARNAAFHLNQTQPDHATNQPWALHAFAQHPDTRPLADHLLHAATLLGGAGGSTNRGVTSILLADALYCLRLTRNTPMTTPNATAIDPDLLSILRCPLTRSPLRQEGDFLVAEAGGLRYPVRDGFPVMLIEEAQLPEGIDSLERFKEKFAAQIPARP
jgi:uncharacterized protein YbaR (Trm112 family)